MEAQLWNRRLKVLSIVIVAVAFLGVLDTTYLSASHLKGVELLCGELGDCTQVTTSHYSRVFGVPVAYLGFLYYSFFFLSSLTVAVFKRKILVLPLFLVSVTGLLASGWFVFAQLVLLRSICIYCMFSAVTSTTLFILSGMLWRNVKKASLPHPTDSTESEQA